MVNLPSRILVSVQQKNSNFTTDSEENNAGYF